VIEDHVAIVTLNEPKALNALSGAFASVLTGLVPP
jgi:enoyl-CoA hydratase/carnithine racemase